MRQHAVAAMDHRLHRREGIMLRQDMEHTLEPVAKEHRIDGEIAEDHRGDGEQDQRHGHHLGRFVDMLLGVLVPGTLTMEDQEEHAEAVKRGNEDTGQHQPIGITGTGDA